MAVDSSSFAGLVLPDIPQAIVLAEGEGMQAMQIGERRQKLLSVIRNSVERIDKRLSAGGGNSSYAYLQACYSMLLASVESMNAGDPAAEYLLSTLAAQYDSLSEFLEKVESLEAIEALKKGVDELSDDEKARIGNALNLVMELDTSIYLLGDMRFTYEAIQHDIAAIHVGTASLNAAMKVADILLAGGNDQRAVDDAVKQVGAEMAAAAKAADPHITDREIANAVADAVVAGAQIHVAVKQDRANIMAGVSSFFTNTQKRMAILGDRYIGTHVKSLQRNVGHYVQATQGYLSARFRGGHAEELAASAEKTVAVAMQIANEVNELDRIGQMNNLPGLMDYFNKRVEFINGALKRADASGQGSELEMINEDLSHLNEMREAYANVLLGKSRNIKETANLLEIDEKDLRKEINAFQHVNHIHQHHLGIADVVNALHEKIARLFSRPAKADGAEMMVAGGMIASASIPLSVPPGAEIAEERSRRM